MEHQEGALQAAHLTSLDYVDAQLAATELTAEEMEVVEAHRMHIEHRRQVRHVSRHGAPPGTQPLSARTRFLLSQAVL